MNFIYKLLQGTILILLFCNVQYASANGKCGKKSKSCGPADNKVCCATGYICKSNQCVFNINVKLKQVHLKGEPSEPETKMSEKAKVDKVSISNPISINKLINSAAYQSDSYKGLAKGNYIKCFDGEIQEIKGHSKASLHTCEKHGGVLEYKVVD
jgi:hypothetical protein